MKQQYCGVLQTLPQLQALIKKNEECKVYWSTVHSGGSSTSSFQAVTGISNKHCKFSLLQSQVKANKQQLNKILEEESPPEKLKGDVDSFENRGCDITFPLTLYEQMQRLSQKYVTALTQNLGERFASSSHVISALSIFDPLSVPEYQVDGFHEYGTAQVNILAKHFFQIETQEVQKLETEKLLTEWSHT